MNSLIIASAAALGAVPVAIVSLLAIVTLLCVRAVSGVMRVALSRVVSQLLDGSIVVLFLLYVVLVIIRFKTIG